MTAKPEIPQDAELEQIPAPVHERFKMTTTQGEHRHLPAQGQWTREDWLRLSGDGWRYEVIDGVLYMLPPTKPRHQLLLTTLAAKMWHHVHQNQLGQVLSLSCLVQLPTQPVPVQPDIIFIQAEHQDIIGENQVSGAPDLLVEILSLSNSFYDRREKLAVYQKAGIAEYWIVDPDLETIEVFILSEAIYALLGWWGMEEQAHSRIMTGFKLDLADLF